ncbi:hypothetical protein MHU86_12241 [Fragilaria crotonensis]|nr:hypothetical protein MHU86_12241 [Fragilaria crotonensis]
MVKSLNKKVSLERKKGDGGGGKKNKEKSGGKKDGDFKKDGDHPKKWQAPKAGDKKESMYKGHITKQEGENNKKEDKKYLATKKLKVAKAYIARIEKHAAEADTVSELTAMTNDLEGGTELQLQ